MTFSDLQEEARRSVEAVRDDPEGRYQLRARFYATHDYVAVGSAGYGNSELAFLRWEVDRGVLDPPDGPGRRGSPWWRAVNEALLYGGQLAALVQDAGLPAEAAPLPVQPWLAYFAERTPRAWYRAHNTSVVTGYLEHIDLARTESAAECAFLNIVLYRVLFAQAMVEGASFALGRFGELLADPDLPAVHELVRNPDFYPHDYPLTDADVRAVLHRGHHLGNLEEDLLDEALILPHLGELYARAADWLSIPTLSSWLRAGKPDYPGPAVAIGSPPSP
jgi:hypothetical protein